MVSVEDCIWAVIFCIEKKIPNEIFNLASQKKIKVKNLLNNLISSANSSSKILPLNAKLIKNILNLSDLIGLDIMYKEQYKIADKDIFLDISKANTLLNWHPKYDDQAMINQAYNYWLENFINK
jgi:dTDP-glucose 4,6-dehydratase